jgi:hypothetical protein
VSTNKSDSELAATGFRWHAHEARAGKAGREGATFQSVAPSAFANGQLDTYTHSTLETSTDARISPVGLTVRCTVFFT